MIVGAVIGGGLALGGALLSSNSQDRATDAAVQAAQFRPFDVSTGQGVADINLQDQTAIARAQGNVAGIEQGLLNNSLSNVNQLQSPFGLGEFSRNIQGTALGQVPFLAAQQGQLGQEDLMRLQGLLPGVLGSQALGAGAAQAGGLFGLQQGIGQLGQDFNQVRSQELDFLRQQSLPDEQNFANSTLNRLFNSGQLGTTGGANSQRALSTALQQADAARQSQAFSNALAQRNQGAALLQQGIGGLQAGNSLFGNLLGTGITGGAAINDRATSRLGDAQQLFGFGDQAQSSFLNQSLGSLAGAQTIDDRLRASLALGGNIGGQQAQAGATAATALLANNESPAGSFFGELGTGLINKELGIGS